MSASDTTPRYSDSLRRAIAAALGVAAVGTCLPMTTAFAQEQEEELEEITVTGSVLRRTDEDTVEGGG